MKSRKRARRACSSSSCRTLTPGASLPGFLLLFQASGDYSFGSLHNIGAVMSPGARNAAFLLFLLGFGVKSGIIPLHIWLPVAHPVAPSNVSALMSGVLIKTGIYGLTRVCFDFLGPPPLWWGVTILAVGTVSAVLGVLYALDGTRPETAAGLSQHREHRHHSHGPWAHR